MAADEADLWAPRAHVRTPSQTYTRTVGGANLATRMHGAMRQGKQGPGGSSPNGTLGDDRAQPLPTLRPEATVAQTEALEPLVVFQAREDTLKFFISKPEKTEQTTWFLDCITGQGGRCG